jgi:hypothetical protein
MEVYFDFVEQLLEAQRGYVQRVREVVLASRPDDAPEVEDVDDASGAEVATPPAPLVVLNGRPGGHFASAHK